MMLASALIACAMLVSLGMVHLYWALGGSVGKNAAIPSVNGKAVLTPGPTITAFIGIVLFLMAALVGGAAGLFTIPLSSNVLKAASALLAFVFLARAIGDLRYVGFFKRVKGSAFADRDSYFYSPLCLVLAMLISIVAAG